MELVRLPRDIVEHWNQRRKLLLKKNQLCNGVCHQVHKLIPEMSFNKSVMTVIAMFNVHHVSFVYKCTHAYV